jgi:phosphatidylserine/phosphatidylglycerophosphate/cardiolipin synthase-like enzyme
VRTRLPLALYAAAALALTGCAATTSTPSATSSQPAQPGSAPVTHASAHDSSSASITSGRLALITEPQDGIAPVLSAVKGARREVDMVMYEDNDTQLDSALAVDAHRGVTVRVLLNGGYYGRGFPQDQAAYNYLEAHAVPVRWTPSYFALTHQKTLIIDGRAYILTFNLTPQYYASSRDFGVIDTNAADDAAIEQTFNADWTGRRTTAPAGHDLVWSPGSQAAQVKLIESATGWVDIYNEEMDSPAIESALEGDARRGVNVRVTMTADSSWNSAFAQLAAAGVHVRTYAANAALYIHAKMILTPAKVFLGSENFSITSTNRNRELGLITPDGPIRASLSRTFDADYANATPYTSGGGTSTSSGSSTSAQCSVTASHSSRYDDWDVYVRSDRPEATATVTDSSGATASYHTDSSGYADIYLKAPASAAGQSITVHVGSATCTGTL